MTLVWLAVTVILGLRFTWAAWDLPKRWESIGWLWAFSVTWPVWLVLYLLLNAWMYWVEDVK